MTQAVTVRGCWEGHEYMAEIRAPFAMQLSGTVFGAVRVIDPKDRSVRPLSDYPEKVASNIYCSAWMKMAKTRIPNLVAGPAKAELAGMVLVDGSWPGVVKGYVALQHVAKAGTEHFVTDASLTWPAMIGPDSMYYAIQPAGCPPGIYIPVTGRPRDVMRDVPFSPEYDDAGVSEPVAFDEAEVTPPTSDDEVEGAVVEEEEKEDEVEEAEKKSEDDEDEDEDEEVERRMPRRIASLQIADEDEF